jgi:hypothetical protein
MNAGGSADEAPHPMTQVYTEAWTILEMHFLTRPHLMAEARERLARCLDRLRVDGHGDPHVLKDLACRIVQLEYGPAPAEAQAAEQAGAARTRSWARPPMRRQAPSPILFASAR